MSEWQLIGPHRFRDRDEILCFEPHGVLSLPQAETWAGVMTSHFEQQQKGCLLVDARDLTPPPAEIRRLFVGWLRDHQPRPRIIIFGANLLMRTISRLVLAAVQSLYKLDVDLALYATEEEAWTYVEQLRRRSQPSA